MTAPSITATTGDLPGSSTDPTPYVVAGIVAILAMFGGLGTWAALAPLKGAVMAKGVLAVESKRKTVQHLEGGIVAEIPVRDNDPVGAGQVLIRLDDTRVRADLAIIEGRLDALMARRARLVAERDGAAWPVFPDALLDRADDPRVVEAIAAETANFEARRDALAGEVAILTQRIAQLREEIRGLSTQERAKVRQAALVEEELAGLRMLYEKGLAPRTRVLALERTAAGLVGERGQHLADISRAESAIAEAELQVLQRTKTVREEVLAELREVQTEIFDLTERRVAALDRLARTNIRAPRAGIVVGLNVHTVGAVIAPGEPILDIVPRGDALVVEAQVQPRDIDKIAPGGAAVVRLPAFNLRTTPELAGTVIDTSADRLIDPATEAPYYLVRVRVPEDEIARLEGLALVPGMPVEVFIQTGERTALSYLVKPFTDALARAFRED